MNFDLLYGLLFLGVYILSGYFTGITIVAMVKYINTKLRKKDAKKL